MNKTISKNIELPQLEKYFRNSINLALQDKMTWSTLSLLLEEMVPTLLECKQLVKVLLEELKNIKEMLVEENMEIIDREDETNLAEKVEQELITNISEVEFDNQASENDGTQNKVEAIDEVSEDKHQVEKDEQENQGILHDTTPKLEDYYARFM